MREQTAMMHEEGWISAAEAQRATGVANVGVIHKQVAAGRVYGTRVGVYWYVSVASLLAKFEHVKAIKARILKLGVKPNAAHLKFWKKTQGAKKS